MGGARDCNHFVLICIKSTINQIQTTSKVWQHFSKVRFEVSLHFFTFPEVVLDNMCTVCIIVMKSVHYARVMYKA